TLTARWFWSGLSGEMVELTPTTLSTLNVRDAPSLALLPDGSIVVAYTVSNQMYTRRWVDTVWGPEAPATFSGTAPVVATSASPGIAWVTAPSDNAHSLADYVTGLYAAVPAGSSHRISLYLFDDSTDTWSLVSPLGELGPRTRGVRSPGDGIRSR